MKTSWDRATNFMLLHEYGKCIVHERIPPGPFRPTGLLGEYVGVIRRCSGAWVADLPNGAIFSYPTRRAALDAMAYYYDKNAEAA